MALFDLPLVAGSPSYRFGMVLQDASYLIDVRWNSREQAFYMDWYTESEAPVVLGIKVVLGTFLGRRSDQAPFKDGVLVAVDTSGAEREATLDDLGTRVIVRYIPVEDLIALNAQIGV